MRKEKRGKEEKHKEIKTGKKERKMKEICDTNQERKRRKNQKSD